MTQVHHDNVNRELPLEQEYEDGSYRWFTYSPDVTGLRLICLEDRMTGTVVTTSTANLYQRTAAYKAWSGARQSRAAGMPWDIMGEMVGKGIDADQKIEEMFHSYGHASVGDMARLTVDFGRIPMHLCLTLFSSSSLNSGQEKSTRYQSRFGKAVLHQLRNYLPPDFPPDELQALEEEYQNFGLLSLTLFNRHREALLPAFANHYQADVSKPEHKNALNSRVLDCVRYFLLFGQWSGMSFETSARDWSRIAAELKDSPIHYYRRVAEQIEHLLSPSPLVEARLRYKAEAPGLIRHTEPKTVTNHNLRQLKKYVQEETDLLHHIPISYLPPRPVPQRVFLLPSRYSETERLVAQYLLMLWPGLERQPLLDWVQALDVHQKYHISELIFAGHNNYNELPAFARTTGMTLVVESFLGELRDLNRHRAWGRFVPLPLVNGEQITYDTAEQILARGFGLPLYLSDVPAFSLLRDAFTEDMSLYYRNLRSFLARICDQYGSNIDYTFVLNLLPLAHQVDLWLHGDPRQALYMTTQRVRPGGHINYRSIAYAANHLLASSDPYLSAMNIVQKPDPSSRDEFFDRS